MRACRSTSLACATPGAMAPAACATVGALGGGADAPSGTLIVPRAAAYQAMP